MSPKKVCVLISLAWYPVIRHEGSDFINGLTADKKWAMIGGSRLLGA
jgi:hypothetical protein